MAHPSREQRTGPLFDRFKLQVERVESSWQAGARENGAEFNARRQHGTRPDFGMTVPPVAERRRQQRKAPEKSSFVHALVWPVVRALFVVKDG
jgi:hypothetical protein